MAPYTSTLSAHAAQANAEILRTLQGFHLPAEMDGDRIDCGFHGMQAWCEDAQVNEAKGVASLLVSLSLGDISPFTLTEKVSHFGADADAAIREAASIWCLSVFVPAAALADPEILPGNMATLSHECWKDLTGQEQTWLVASSPALRHTLGHDPAEDAVYTSPRPDTRGFLNPVFEDLALSTGPKVLKIHLMHSPYGTDGNCAINGIANRPLTDMLRSYDWSNGRPGTLRQYHIMLPGSA